MLIALREGDELRVVAAAGQVSTGGARACARRSRARSAARRCGRAARSASQPGATGLRAPWAKALEARGGARGADAVPRPRARRDRRVRPARREPDVQRGGRAADAGVRGERRDGRGDRPARRRRGHAPRAWRRPSASAGAGRASCTTRRSRSWARSSCCSPAARRSDDPEGLRAALGSGRRAARRRDRRDCASLITDLRPAALDQLGTGPGARGARRARRAPVGTAHLARRSTSRYEAGRAADAARAGDRGDGLPRRAGGAHQRRQARRGDARRRRASREARRRRRDRRPRRRARLRPARQSHRKASACSACASASRSRAEHWRW